jgi:transcriptional regulator of arginine metabolism
MNKQSRQFRIKEIIAKHSLSSQEELGEALRKAGVEVTQATLSRDLKEMGVSRINTADGMKYALLADAEDKQLKNLLSYEIEEIMQNETMIVIKTLPGRAQGVAELIDGLKSPNILATLAGDNTIFVAPTSVKKIANVAKLIREFIVERR